LLALTIQHEKPELETEKTRLLQQEEDKKIQLGQLEESLLEVDILQQLQSIHF
ncbi:Cytoplasmic dynein 2 heavy chain 1, partial [Xenotaenia resolanae]